MLIVAFSMMNTIEVPLNFLNLVTVKVSAYMLILICFLIGVIFTALLGVVERFRMSRTITQLQKQVRELKRDLRAQEPPTVIEEPAPHQSLSDM